MDESTPEPLLQYFDHGMLTCDEQVVAYPFSDVAFAIVAVCPAGDARTRALHSLLDSRKLALAALIPSTN